jgi:hypothetical protein
MLGRSAVLRLVGEDQTAASNQTGAAQGQSTLRPCPLRHEMCAPEQSSSEKQCEMWVARAAISIVDAYRSLNEVEVDELPPSAFPSFIDALQFVGRATISVDELTNGTLTRPCRS